MSYRQSALYILEIIILNDIETLITKKGCFPPIKYKYLSDHS